MSRTPHLAPGKHARRRSGWGRDAPGKSKSDANVGCWFFARCGDLKIRKLSRGHKRAARNLPEW